MSWSIEIVYSPVTPQDVRVREVIRSSFAAAGLTISRERGGDTALGIADVASESLSVDVILILRRDLTPPPWRGVGNACQAIRSALPEVPLGCILRTHAWSAWFAWHTDDTSEDITASTQALVERAPLEEGGVFGWDSACGAWIDVYTPAVPDSGETTEHDQ